MVDGPELPLWSRHKVGDPNSGPPGGCVAQPVGSLEEERQEGEAGGLLL